MTQIFYENAKIFFIKILDSLRFNERSPGKMMSQIYENLKGYPTLNAVTVHTLAKI